MDNRPNVSSCQNCAYAQMMGRKYQKVLTPENCDIHGDRLCPVLDEEAPEIEDLSGGLISRNALLTVIDQERNILLERKMTGAEHILVHHGRRFIESAPCVEAMPVVYSKWVRDGDFLVCLNCESEINIKNSLGVENKKNFCPCCGSRMVEEKGNDE